MKKLAIIGTGISGMSCAYFLQDHFDLTIFEKNDYVGGHTNTIETSYDGEKAVFDTGFMVFNEVTYPNLLKLFKKLDVGYYDTQMSFSVADKTIGVEYNGSSIGGLFSQWQNIFNLKHLKMLFNIDRFNKKSPQILSDEFYSDMTVSEFVEKWQLGEEFLHRFLVPMSSAVWSTPHEKMLEFPIKTLVRFFFNHGFMGLNTQHQWKTVKGGSREYRDKLIGSFKERIKVSSKVERVVQHLDGVDVYVNGIKHSFDKVIMASHADESYAVIENPTDVQRSILSQFSYHENTAIVHTDINVLPKLKKNWSAWNYISDTGARGTQTFTVYNMNVLQNLKTKHHYLININGEEFISKDKIIKKIKYHHPVFDIHAVNAQKRIHELNAYHSNIYFCGAWQRYGFHEDGLLSAVNLCESILGKEVL